MKSFKPSDDFVSRVMGNIYACEGMKAARFSLAEKILVSRPLRYAMSGGGIFLGIFLSPVACI
jgi:hypothetical protein